MTQQSDILTATTDQLSAVGRKLLQIDLENAYTAFVPEGPGNDQAAAVLDGLSPQELFDEPVIDEEHGHATLSGLWLWHDWLDKSHTISQFLKGPTGSFWHAVMHRREGDFSNSKYWYDRVGDHPAYAVIAGEANTLLSQEPADKKLFRLTATGWNPHALVDLIADVHGQGDSHPHAALARRLQLAEFRHLFEHSVRVATRGR